VSKLADKIPGTGSRSVSRQNSRQNSRSMARRKSGTELESFEDARTHLSRPSGSSDASYHASDSLAEPTATHQYALLIRHHLLLQCGACLAHCWPSNVQSSANLTVVWRLACCFLGLPGMCAAPPQLAVSWYICLIYACMEHMNAGGLCGSMLYQH